MKKGNAFKSELEADEKAKLINEVKKLCDDAIDTKWQTGKPDFVSATPIAYRRTEETATEEKTA